jgi:fumarate reductase subunit C
MNLRTYTVLWALQRATGALLVVFVLVHLLTVIYAVRGGLSAAEILGRTRGSSLWATFYLLFVLATAVHAPIGLRAILLEWFKWEGRSRDVMVLLIGVFIAIFGWRAVWGVFA